MPGHGRFAFYKKIFIFQDLDAEELQRILQLTEPRFFAANATIIKKGSPGTACISWCEGEVNITKRLTLVLDQDLPEEKRMIRLKAADGVSFGEMALLENDTRSATVTALTDCRLLELKRDDFLGFIRQTPSPAARSCCAWPSFCPGSCARPTRTW